MSREWFQQQDRAQRLAYQANQIGLGPAIADGNLVRFSFLTRISRKRPVAQRLTYLCVVLPDGRVHVTRPCSDLAAEPTYYVIERTAPLDRVYVFLRGLYSDLVKPVPQPKLKGPAVAPAPLFRFFYGPESYREAGCGLVVDNVGAPLEDAGFDLMTMLVAQTIKKRLVPCVTGCHFYEGGKCSAYRKLYPEGPVVGFNRRMKLDNLPEVPIQAFVYARPDGSPDDRVPNEPELIKFAEYKVMAPLERFLKSVIAAPAEEKAIVHGTLLDILTRLRDHKS